MVLSMTDEELNIIAEKICIRMKAEQKSFSIEPETHYNSHKDISELVADYRNAKSVFWKAFIGLAVIGGVVLATIGLGHYK